MKLIELLNLGIVKDCFDLYGTEKKLGYFNKNNLKDEYKGCEVTNIECGAVSLAIDIKENKTMKKIINLTPHMINIEGQDPIPSEGIARCQEISKIVDNINGIDIIEKSFGELIDLPAPRKDTIFVVSIIAANAAKKAGRVDCFVPGEQIRDESGRIIGCKNLARI
jgi:hypothetical protein